MKIPGLTQNKQGYWRFQPSSKGLPKGSPRPSEIWLGTMDEDEALAKVIDIRGAEFQQRKGARLAEWVDAYLEGRRSGGHYRPSTMQIATLYLQNYLVPHFGASKAPESITRADALRWFDKLTEGRSLSTAHAYIRYARSFYSWMIEQGEVKENPFSNLKLPTPAASRREKFCSLEQRDAMLSANESLETFAVRDEMRFVLHCGFFLGMRIREILEARWGWFAVTGASGYCVVGNDGQFETKNRKVRTIPFNRRFLDYFNALPASAPDRYIIKPERDYSTTRNHRWDCRDSFKRVAKEAKLPWVSFHTMRHTYGSLHTIAGTPETKIRRWMGITAETLEKHYAGLSPTDPDADRI